MDKIEWVDGTTKLNKTTMDTFQDNIDNAITEVYSTEEVKTNKVWIDGKPIYRKVFLVSQSDARAVTVSISDLNISTCFVDVSHSYFHDVTNGRYTPVVVTNVSAGLSKSANASSQADIYINNSKTDFTVEGGYDISWGTAYVTLEYTKTTD